MWNNNCDLEYKYSFASLDLGLVANSFCLLRLPKMPELRDILLKHNNKLPNFHGAAYDINIFSIPYKGMYYISNIVSIL